MKQSLPKPFLTACPFCQSPLTITRIECDSCDTRIESNLAIPHFFQMPADLQEFVVAFLRVRGNIREMEKELGVSYPTVCKRLDQVNAFLSGGAIVQTSEASPERAPKPVPVVNPREVLQQVEQGKITAAEAARLLREG